MDSSSAPQEDNRDKDEADIGEEEEEFLTPNSNQRAKRKQPPGGADTSDQENTKNQRILPTRSDVWAHFTRMENNQDRCICHYCKNDYACPTKSGTTNLRNHLGSCRQYKTWQESQDLIQNQKVINKQGNLQNAKVPKSVFREATNEMLVIGELPLSFVEGLAFRHFCNRMNMYKPHSRRTAATDIVQMFVDRKATMRKWFLANKQSHSRLIFGFLILRVQVIWL